MMVQRTTDAGGRPRAAISVSLRLFPLVAHSGHWRQFVELALSAKSSQSIFKLTFVLLGE